MGRNRKRPEGGVVAMYLAEWTEPKATILSQYPPLKNKMLKKTLPKTLQNCLLRKLHHT